MKFIKRASQIDKEKYLVYNVDNFTDITSVSDEKRQI